MRKNPDYRLMNFEELIQTKTQRTADQQQLPLGCLRRVQIGQRSYQIISIKQELIDNQLFQDDLKEYSRRSASLPAKWQIHHCPVHSLEELEGTEGKEKGTEQAETEGKSPEAEKSGHARFIVLEQGSWMSFDKMLRETPQLVADDHFINEVTSQLFAALENNHQQGIHHLCLAPSILFVRKGEHTPVLLHAGSFFSNIHDVKNIYQGLEEFVAPEVKDNQTTDARSDIYALGKLLEYIFQFSSAPYTYKRLIKKATQPVAENRYQSVGEMKRALKRLQTGYQATLALSIGAILSAIIYFGLNTFTPQPEDMEYVKPAQTDSLEDDFDKGFNAETEFGTKMTNDSGLQFTADEVQQMKEYEAKAEAIFKKQFTAKAEQILGKAYNKNAMKGNEKSFKAATLNMTEELIQAQRELAKESGISNTKSEKIASEIIEQLSEKMMKEALK